MRSCFPEDITDDIRIFASQAGIATRIGVIFINLDDIAMLKLIGHRL